MVAWYGAGAATAGVYKSSDGGSSWKLMSGLPSGSGLANAVRLESASTTGVVYASCFAICGRPLRGKRKLRDCGGA
jgi:hypothetical protein